MNILLKKKIKMPAHIRNKKTFFLLLNS